MQNYKNTCWIANINVADSSIKSQLQCKLTTPLIETHFSETICKKLPNTRYSKDYHHAWLDKLGGLDTAFEKCLSNPECVGISTETKQGAQKPHYVWFFKAGHTVKTTVSTESIQWTSYDCSKYT